MSASVPINVVRKPGFAIFGALVTALVNLLLGSSYGIQVIIAGLLQALGMEIGFFVGGKHKGNLVNMAVGGILASLLVFCRDYIVFGYSSLGAGVLIARIVVRIASAIIIGTILTKGITGGLVKTGTLKGFKAAE